MWRRTDGRGGYHHKSEGHRPHKSTEQPKGGPYGSRPSKEDSLIRNLFALETSVVDECIKLTSGKCNIDAKIVKRIVLLETFKKYLTKVENRDIILEVYSSFIDPVNPLIIGLAVETFPYKILFAKPPTFYFENLKKYFADEKPITFSESGYKYSRSGIYGHPPEKAVVMTSKPGDYENIEIITDVFMETVRVKCRFGGEISPYEKWVHLAREEGLKRSLGVVAARDAREGLYKIAPRECTLFKVTVVAWIADRYKPKRVLDPFAGWGDRMIGFASRDVEYVGFDPNLNLKPGHDAIKTHFGLTNSTITYVPFEDAELTGTFDLVFSSPPYWDLEDYSREKTQSHIRYRSFEDWLTNFLFQSITKAWDSLKVGGHLILHIADTKSMPDGCARMNYFIDTKPDSQYVTTLFTQGVSGVPRPMWCWKKVTSKKPTFVTAE